MNRGDEAGHPACFRSNQMQRRRPAAHRAGDEAAVEACELAAVLDGEREQPGVGDLGGCAELVDVDQGAAQQTEFAGPEPMTRRSAQTRERSRATGEPQGLW